MSICSSCGNDYPKSFKIVLEGQSYFFDCFECAIHQLAPKCSTCGCKIIGHGIEHEDFDKYYCCAHCARANGIMNAKDHV